MNTLLNDVLASLLSIFISILIFIPNFLTISLSIVSLVLAYFLFKYANKYMSIFILVPFFLLIASKYNRGYYYISVLTLLFFLFYTFFYVTQSKNRYKVMRSKFDTLQTQIKDFLNILTAFDYLPNNIKIFDELTDYMKKIFPEVYSIVIFQKTPFGWKCKSAKNLPISIKNSYIDELNPTVLSKYFSLEESKLFTLNVELEGEIYAILYNLVSKIDNQQLMEYFFRTLLVLSLRFEKKYFLGLENALVNEYDLIHFDVYQKFSQTILEMASKMNSTVVFVLVHVKNDLVRIVIDKIKASVQDFDLVIAMGSDKFLILFPNSKVRDAKNILKFDNVDMSFAQYPEDGINTKDIITVLEQRLSLEKRKNDFVR